MNPNSAQKSTHIVIMGDSNTEGYGLAHEHQSYPYKLQTYFGEMAKVYNMGVTSTCVINATLDSQTVGMPYAREAKYHEALNIQGDIYVINLGTNDAQDGMDDKEDLINIYSDLIPYHHQFVEDYMNMIYAIRRRHPLAKIVICIPIPIRQCIWRKHQQVYLERLYPYFHQILARDSSLIAIDLTEVLRHLPESLMDTLYLADGLHLNDAGTTLMADALFPVLQALILS